MEINDSIGVRLREVREKMGLSQTAFAEIAERAGAVGTTRQSQSNYEKGKRAPDASYFSAIAAAGADTQYILTGETKQQQLLKALRESTAQVVDLPLAKECRAAIAQLLVGLQGGDVGLITNALENISAEYGGTAAEMDASTTLRPDQSALLDNLDHCSTEDQAAIKRMALLAAQAAKAEPEQKLKRA